MPESSTNHQLQQVPVHRSLLASALVCYTDPLAPLSFLHQRDQSVHQSWSERLALQARLPLFPALPPRTGERLHRIPKGKHNQLNALFHLRAKQVLSSVSFDGADLWKQHCCRVPNVITRSAYCCPRFPHPQNHCLVLTMLVPKLGSPTESF